MREATEKVKHAASEAKSTRERKSEQDRKTVSPGSARPTMIHRAIAGSVECFVNILMEYFAGK
jgi:threonyl-tRNA synthetase